MQSLDSGEVQQYCYLGIWLLQGYLITEKCVTWYLLTKLIIPGNTDLFRGSVITIDLENRIF